MNIAIYSRKSKYTGKGESIENQIQTCREYAEAYLKNIDNIFIYEDEGFSAKDTDRPEFKRMMSDAHKGRFDALICYRLDRVSRNVSNFSDMLETLQDLNIDFISVSEKFDTSTPMGRAMIYIASVFAQLERETMAERLRDNMHGLARTGRWLGGRAPMGFESKRITYYDEQMNKRTLYKLTPKESEMEIVRVFFDKYIELGSLSKLEGWVHQQGIKSKSGRPFEISSMTFILKNPVYCVADELSYEYFQKADSDIASEKSEFDGQHGLMVFNKHDERNNRVRKKDMSEWIIAVAKHKGVIPSSKWVQVQQMLKVNSTKAPRMGTGKYGLIAGIIRCSCGSPMKITIKKKANKTGYYYYYKCLAKERSRGIICQMKNLNGANADAEIVQKIKDMAHDTSDLMKRLEKEERKANEFINMFGAQNNDLDGEIELYEKKIKNLTQQLADNRESVAAKYIIKEIEELDSKLRELRKEMFDVDDTAEMTLLRRNSIKIYRDMILEFNKTFDKLEPLEQRDFIRRIIKRVVWDGEKLEAMPFD